MNGIDLARLEAFEKRLHNSLGEMLTQADAIDNRLPDAPDIEDRWEKICLSYLPDGTKEFASYPTASLGWMMFIGMAMAHMWDEDWEMYSRFDDIYATILKKGRGYDAMDEYICQDILKLNAQEEEKTGKLVGKSAKLALTDLMREGFEPSTPDAFNAYVRCLHQLYYYGAAIELRRLGYHMTPLAP